MWITVIKEDYIELEKSDKYAHCFVRSSSLRIALFNFTDPKSYLKVVEHKMPQNYFKCMVSTDIDNIAEMYNMHVEDRDHFDDLNFVWIPNEIIELFKTYDDYDEFFNSDSCEDLYS